MVWLLVVRVEAYAFSVLRRSRCRHFPAEGGGARAEKSTTRGPGPRHRRSAFRGRSHGGGFCGRVGPPLGSGPLLRWRRFATWPPPFLSPSGRQEFVQFHPGGCFG